MLVHGDGLCRHRRKACVLCSIGCAARHPASQLKSGNLLTSEHCHVIISTAERGSDSSGQDMQCFFSFSQPARTLLMCEHIATQEQRSGARPQQQLLSGLRLRRGQQSGRLLPSSPLLHSMPMAARLRWTQGLQSPGRGTRR